MGAEPYWYYVPYEENKENALQKLRKREFEAGRYSPVMYTGQLDFPINETEAPTPGKEHETIGDAIEDAMESGTGSILDLEKVSEDDYYGVAHILSREELVKYFNTDKPARNIVDEKVWELWDDISNSMGVRGAGICITVYNDREPSELLFMGYSWD